MRTLLACLCLLLAVTFVAPASAQDEAPPNEDRANRRAEMRERMLKEFDTDGDGELNDEERTKAREAMRERRGGGDRPQGDRAREGRPRGERPQGDRRRGPDGPLDPGKLFDKYDANNDGQLSRAEFTKLSEEMRQPRRPGEAGGRGPRAAGDRPRGPRPDGPPPEDRRVERQRPLQNPGDESDRPRARPAGRRLSDDDGPRGRRPGSRDRDPGPGDREGWQPPSPEQVFERFDENKDDQLSREEFMKLADRMRQMRERMEGPSPERDGERGAREGRGPRRGPPGEDGPRRGGRPQRPPLESDAGPRISAEDDSV